MKPIKFEGQNVIFGENQPEYQPLPAKITDEGNVITCWKLSDDELKKVNETGEIWLSVMTFKDQLQPIYLTTNKEELI